MTIRRSLDIQDGGMREVVLVTMGRGNPALNPWSCGDELPIDYALFHGNTWRGHDYRRCIAQDFLKGHRNGFWMGYNRGHCLWKGIQAEHCTAYEIACGLVTGHQQEHACPNDFLLAQLFSIDAGGLQGPPHIVPTALATSLSSLPTYLSQAT